MTQTDSNQAIFKRWKINLPPLPAQEQSLQQQMDAAKKGLYRIITPSQMQCIRVSGTLNHTFLQGQLTCDLDLLAKQKILLGAYCNHQGRMLGNFFIWKDQADFLLCMDHSLISIMTETLHKYAQFSKVQVTPQLDMHCFFLLEAAENASSTPAQKLASSTDKELNAVKSTATSYQLELEQNTHRAYVIRHSAEANYVWCCGNAAACQNWLQHYQSQSATNTTYISSGDELETACMVQQALPWIKQATSLLWTPHMLDWPLYGGVSFSKGCYVGQEIIARTQHLGKLKRHLYSLQSHSNESLSKQENMASTITVPQEGAIIYNKKQQPMGQIVSAYANSSGWDGLAVLEDRALLDPLTQAINTTGPPVISDHLCDLYCEKKPISHPQRCHQKA